MERITEKMLEALVQRINYLVADPDQPTVGFYHLDWAYGGVELQRVANTSGGVNCMSLNGHESKRNLYNFMRAYVVGIEQAQLAAIHAGLYK